MFTIVTKTYFSFTSVFDIFYDGVYVMTETSYAAAEHMITMLA